MSFCLMCPTTFPMILNSSPHPTSIGAKSGFSAFRAILSGVDQALQRGLAVDDGGNDVVVFSELLASDDDHIAGFISDVPHACPIQTQCENTARSGERGVHHHGFAVIIGERLGRRTARNHPQQGDRRLHAPARLHLFPYNIGAARGVFAFFKVSLLHQRLDYTIHAGGGDAEAVGDLLHGRQSAVSSLMANDLLHDLRLSGGDIL